MRPDLQRPSDARVPSRARFWSPVRRLARRQSHFSIMSAALGAMLAILLFIDYAVGAPSFDAGIALFWAANYIVLSVLPLALGRRYPRWLGLLFVAYMTVLAAFTMVNAEHPHFVVNTLLEVPVVAIYLGWFFRPWLARTALALNLLVLGPAVLLDSDVLQHEFSIPLALLYTVLIAWFCLETGIHLSRRTEFQATHDSLTGALNRRGLGAYGGRALARAARTGEPLVVAVVDFDDFKAVNDGGGHAEGDRALRACSAAWSEGLGGYDLVARTGGDEFALLIHGDEEAAHRRLEELRRRSSYPWSWGLAAFIPGDTLDSLMLRADHALYEGRERSAR